MTIKFNQHNVTDGSLKARVFYSLDNRSDGRLCVTLYAKDFSDDLPKMFTGGEYKNDTDSQSDYFDEGRVVLFAEHPLYQPARERAEANLVKAAEKRAAKLHIGGARA